MSDFQLKRLGLIMIRSRAILKKSKARWIPLRSAGLTASFTCFHGSSRRVRSGPPLRGYRSERRRCHQ